MIAMNGELAVTDHSDRWWRWSEQLPRPLRNLLQWRFFRFLVVGGINTLFGYGVFAALILLGLWYPIAALISTVAGILFNFKSYGALVFGRHDNVLLIRFFAVYGVCYLIGLAPLAWAKAHGISVLVMAAAMLLPMAGVSFLLNRAFVYGSGRP